MRAVGKLLVIFVVFSLLFVSFEAKKKKKRGWNSQRQLKRICRKQGNSSKVNYGLELHAFFDFTPKDKTYACLKITTCSETPMCFVTSYPKNQNNAFNDTTKWWNMLSYLQKGDRRIEPIHDSSMNGWNGDKYKVLSQYVQNQPVIYRMCLDATMYRFARNNNSKTNTTANDNNGKRAVNSSNPQASNASNIPLGQTSTSGIDPVSLCPVLEKKNRQQQRKTIIPMRFLLCKGQHCPCVRICVGQGRNQSNFHDCSTFRVICTFKCAPRLKSTQVPNIGSPTGNTGQQKRLKLTKRRKLRGQKKSTTKNRRRQWRKFKKSQVKKNNKKQPSGIGIGIG